MLSKQDQEKRARLISSLYGKPLKRNIVESDVGKKHRWPVTLLVAATFSAPFSISSALFSFYNNSPYVSLSDIQSWSILFVVYFIGLVGVYLIFLKFSREELRRHYVLSGFIFKLSLLFMIPLAYWLHEFIAGGRPQEVPEILTRISIYTIAAYIVTATLLRITTFIAEKRLFTAS